MFMPIGCAAPGGDCGRVYRLHRSHAPSIRPSIEVARGFGGRPRQREPASDARRKPPNLASGRSITRRETKQVAMPCTRARKIRAGRISPPGQGLGVRVPLRGGTDAACAAPCLCRLGTRQGHSPLDCGMESQRPWAVGDEAQRSISAPGLTPARYIPHLM